LKERTLTIVEWRQISARWRSVAPARRTVVDFARRFGFSDEELHDIATGVGEAITYVAERAAARGRYLEVSYRGIGRSLEIEIQDSGFQVEAEATGDQPRSDLERGLGVQLMYRTMDYLDITHNGLRIHLIKKRDAATVEEP
jgi:anti-sigma regulatory factor (Ser/Thr protein kinase)